VTFSVTIFESPGHDFCRHPAIVLEPMPAEMRESVLGASPRISESGESVCISATRATREHGAMAPA
jgi:hypothetical protein